MIKINEKSACCGCGACVQSCPRQCIKLSEDFEGFLYPSISKRDCIECGMCESVCPIANNKKQDGRLLETYIAFAKKMDIRMKSSSGGIFSVLANNILECGGKVYGVALDQDKMAYHIEISNTKELYRIQGSKYIQSYTGNSFYQAKQALDNGFKVLFSGTECQIAGLKKYLKKDYANLITVGILCHGVPSPKVWKKYLSEQENRYNSKAIDINFRKKSHGWRAFAINIIFDNGKQYEKKYNEDRYMKFFLSNLSLRPSCYNCLFKDLDRESDITIGDCWGIENYMPHMDDDCGTSVVLIHTEKGLKLFEEISKELEMSFAELEKALPITADSRKSVTLHYNRNKFFKALNKEKTTMYLMKYMEDTLDRKIKSEIKKILIKLKHELISL